MDLKKTSVTPVILAGGTGTRLWPVSRKHYPKQFSNFFGDHSLFQQCALRLQSSETLEFTSPVVVSGADFRFIIGEQLLDVDVTPGKILIEPQPKNTAAAVFAATLYALKQNPEAVLLVAPSDHLISDVLMFHKAIGEGLKRAQDGNLVIFAIKPTGPETGYGYLKLSSQTGEEAVQVDSFVEKPDTKNAARMLQDGSYYWNAGIFLFRAKDMLEAFRIHKPGLIPPVSEAIENGAQDLDFFRLDEASWEASESISIDHAIMEKVDNLYAVPFAGGWTDLGSWDALKTHTAEPDDDGNVVYGPATTIDCSNTMLRSEDQDQHVVGLGLQNINVITTKDAVLVMKAANSQAVGKAVELLRRQEVSQADSFPWEHRPWGRFDVLVEREGFKVKRILVKPGGILSLQKHQHRSEHWVVVIGRAKVTVDDKVTFLDAGESIHVPVGAVHRMENPGDEAMILIEVQTGEYLGEDDIIRYEDIYSR